MGMTNIHSKINEKKDNVNDLQKFVSSLNTTLVNMAIPFVIDDIKNATNTFDNILSSPQSKVVQDVDRWLPITILVLICATCIFGIFAIARENRLYFAIVSVLIILMFIFVLVYATSGSILSLLLSNYCVGGVDNHTVIIIDGLVKENCTREVLKNYLFCKWDNAECDPFPHFLSLLNTSIDEFVKKRTNDSNNPDVKYWNQTIDTLNDIYKSVIKLQQCGSTQITFLQTTTLLCYDTATNLVYLASTWQILTGLIFIHLMITFYSWNRIALKYNPEYKLIHDNDDNIPLMKTNKHFDNHQVKDGKRGLKRSTTDLCDWSPGCFSFLIVMAIVILGMATFVILVYFFGSTDAYISR